jgi:tryptophan synthase alpha chain
VPFSDPVADGPVIQRASERSLKEGTTFSTILEIANRVRKKSNVPLVLFTYYNPLLSKGLSYLNVLKSAGFDAVLIVDLPAPQDVDVHPYFRAMKEARLQSIFLVTPSTDQKRLSQIVKVSQGFLYYACQKGTTGARAHLPSDVPLHLSRIRQETNLPVAVGFGIADRASAAAALQAGDAFVVGSAFVALMGQRQDPLQLKRLAEVIDPRPKGGAL